MVAARATPVGGTGRPSTGTSDQRQAPFSIVRTPTSNLSRRRQARREWARQCSLAADALIASGDLRVSGHAGPVSVTALVGLGSTALATWALAYATAAAAALAVAAPAGAPWLVAALCLPVLIVTAGPLLALLVRHGSGTLFTAPALRTARRWVALSGAAGPAPPAS